MDHAAQPSPSPKPGLVDRVRHSIRATRDSRRTVQELLRRQQVRSTMISAHVPHLGWGAVRSPADRLLAPEVVRPTGPTAPRPISQYAAGPRQITRPPSDPPEAVSPRSDADLGQNLPQRPRRNRLRSWQY